MEEVPKEEEKKVEEKKPEENVEKKEAENHLEMTFIKNMIKKAKIILLEKYK